jgi:hypothetical protein
MTVFNLGYNVSGLSIYDWGQSGEYSAVAEIFNVSPEIAPLIGFSLSYACISLFIFLQNRLQLLKRYRWFEMIDKLE